MGIWSDKTDIRAINAYDIQQRLRYEVSWYKNPDKDYGRKIPPNDVLNYPGAGFLTKVIGRECSTTDYLLVWYEGKTRTEYYYVGEDFLFKHGGQIDIPRDIKEYIRLK